MQSVGFLGLLFLESYFGGMFYDAVMPFEDLMNLPAFLENLNDLDHQIGALWSIYLIFFHLVLVYFSRTKAILSFRSKRTFSGGPEPGRVIF